MFYSQLTYDRIITDFEHLSQIVGDLQFYATNNDKKTIGFQNHWIYELDYWKYQYETIENMPVRDLTNRMNTALVPIGKGRNISDYTTPVKEMKKRIGK